MLSQKLQDDLMTAYQKVYEEKRGHAAGASDAEKQASQLASDVRYKAQSKIPKGASEEEKRKIYLQILNASPAPNVVKAMAKEKLMGEKKKTVKEAKYDNRYSDNTGEESKKKKKALEKKRGMKLDKHPQFTREENAPRMQKGAMAYDGPNKERSEAADRVLAKAKAKRKKMKEEYVTEVLGKVASAAKKMAITDAQKKALKTKFALTQGQKEVLGGRTTLGKVTRVAGAVGGTLATGAKLEADAQDRRDKRKKNIMNKPNFTTSDAYSSYNLKMDYTPDSESIDEMKVKQVVKPKPARNPQNMALPKGVKSGVNYQNMAQSYVPVGNIFNEKKMDPVGSEDKDIDNDGDHDSTDKYLLNRRKAIGKAIAKKRGKVKEGFSAWRIDLDFNEQVKK